MPGPITHLKAADLYFDGSCLEPSAFYLGSVSPDSVNIEGHAEKAIRWPAHLRDRDLNVWLGNVKSFWKDNKASAENISFLKGYLLHIITDIVWDMYFERELFMLFAAAGIPPQQRKATRWLELYGYEKLQTELPWFKEDVRPCLAGASSFAVGTLNRSQVAAWQKRIVDGELEQGRPPLFIDDSFMERFFLKVCEVAKTVLD